ncbi:MAG: 4-(cytidine 5'-diphospho)-2-C-methyl-D-erythritol kinase [Pseudomonadota bacterium]
MAADPAAAGQRQDETAGAWIERAPAKINLYLHVTGQRADGYHLLDSLAVFPSIGDLLEAEPASGLSLAIDGPFGDGLPADGDNLVLRAAEAMARGRGLGAALRLTKNLPIASGIGGGSSDAAGALRLLSRLWDRPIPPGLPLSLGADVPVCLGADAQRMQGIGEALSTCPPLPDAWIVLVNPLQAVPTGAVFSGLASKTNPPAPDLPAFQGFEEMILWLGQQRNDLEAPARAQCPAISRVLSALSDTPLARMSGSGATCFSLFPSESAAQACAERLRREERGWWVASAPLQSETPAALEPV